MSLPDFWVVYDHPVDLPHWYVARRWENGEPTQERLLTVDLYHLRVRLAARGLARIDRNEDDEPQVVEMWL